VSRGYPPMRSLRFLPLLALALTATLRAADVPASEPVPKADFVSAFNGKDLTGWKDARRINSGRSSMASSSARTMKS